MAAARRNTIAMLVGHRESCDYVSEQFFSFCVVGLGRGVNFFYAWEAASVGPHRFRLWHRMPESGDNGRWGGGEGAALAQSPSRKSLKMTCVSVSFHSH